MPGAEGIGTGSEDTARHERLVCGAFGPAPSPQAVPRPRETRTDSESENI